MRTTTSFRLDEKLRQRLAAKARLEGITLSALIERLLREGLEMDEHPGIKFNPGPAGRRPTLAGGPDVWEIVSTLRLYSGSESERIKALSKDYDIHERQIKIALDYAAAHREEIDAWVESNDRLLDELERVDAERKRLLA